jgi:hypothetical protein
MADELKIQVVRVFPTPKLLITGDVENWTTVEYTVGGHGPFRIEMLDREFTAAKVQAEMEKKAVEIRKVVTIA